MSGERVDEASPVMTDPDCLLDAKLLGELDELWDEDFKGVGFLLAGSSRILRP